MSGVAKTVVKPVQKGLEKIGVIKEKQGASPLAELAKTAVSKAEATPAAAMREEMMARRRARRGGRALLSEARLTPESGVGGQTLGSGPSV
jgi:hypothetical protein